MIDLEKIQDFNYEGQRLLFKNSKRLDYDRFTIILLEEFDDDYLNLAINIKAKNAKEFDEDFAKIKQIMHQNKRKVSVWIYDNELLKAVDFKEKGLEISDNSVWLMKENLEDFEKFKSDIPIHISKINKEEEKDYPYIVNQGFAKNNEQEPYDGLSESVMEAIKRSYFVHSNFTIEHYIAKYKKEIVGTMTIMYEREIAYIYNVTTKIAYRKKGVCKELMSHIGKRLIQLGIDKVVLQTEAGFYPEKVYKSMGFKEILKGIQYTEKKEIE